MNSEKNVMILAPHTDDGEIGCGGSISRFLREGFNIYYVAFSTANESIPAHLPKNILETEVKEATKRLGIKKENVLIYKFQVRKLNYSRQDILEIMVELKKEYNPYLVFLPSSNDLHQDHYTISVEGMRAFKQTSILGYEIPWNNITFRTQSFIHLNKEDVEKKIYALDAYESQKKRKYINPDFIWSLAKTRGVQIGTDYAEAFEVTRWIL